MKYEALASLLIITHHNFRRQPSTTPPFVLAGLVFAVRPRRRRSRLQTSRQFENVSVICTVAINKWQGHDRKTHAVVEAAEDQTQSPKNLRLRLILLLPPCKSVKGCHGIGSHKNGWDLENWQLERFADRSGFQNLGFSFQHPSRYIASSPPASQPSRWPFLSPPLSPLALHAFLPSAVVCPVTGSVFLQDEEMYAQEDIC
ncbi:hypothetical protein PIB30_041160 [Stylosanthes scabra]|uniref:Uncharacterized protein n=1 Tax=Stylosanthes scabra TaxID=79078 RepID=A0ABU6UFB6_9FABA|nr:hypothetical protein [Stylosanthes scabra]